MDMDLHFGEVLFCIVFLPLTCIQFCSIDRVNLLTDACFHPPGPAAGAVRVAGAAEAADPAATQGHVPGKQALNCLN